MNNTWEISGQMNSFKDLVMSGSLLYMSLDVGNNTSYFFVSGCEGFYTIPNYDSCQCVQVITYSEGQGYIC